MGVTCARPESWLDLRPLGEVRGDPLGEVISGKLDHLTKCGAFLV